MGNLKTGDWNFAAKGFDHLEIADLLEFGGVARYDVHMSDIQLFYLNSETAKRLEHQPFKLEKDLQKLFERHLQELLGVQFLATEFITDITHAGRIDTVGIDENLNPVVIEYKRDRNENVISQGLFYLDWLVNHKADFKLLVLEKLGKSVAEKIDWTSPRLICVAETYGKYDSYAVKQMNRNIQLLVYRRYPNDLLILELVSDALVVNVTKTVKNTLQPQRVESEIAEPLEIKTVRQDLAKSNAQVQEVYLSLETFILDLGDDIKLKELKFYFAFQKIKNFVCVTLFKSVLHLWLKLNPDEIDLSQYTVIKAADMRKVSHWGTGDLQLELRSLEDLEIAKPLIERAYQEN